MWVDVDIVRKVNECNENNKKKKKKTNNIFKIKIAKKSTYIHNSNYKTIKKPIDTF